jgi:hypothetical protein
VLTVRAVKEGSNNLRRTETIVATVLSFVLVGLHIVLLLNRGPLWRDEISSLTLATKPSCHEFWATLELDPFPALFFLLLRVWYALVGDSDFYLRILGCVIGIACIGAFWINARLTGRRTPVLSLALLGFSPALIIWSDSLRAYGLGVFWILIAFGAFWRFLEKPGRWEFGFALATAILSVQSVLTNSLLIFACGTATIFIALRRREPWSAAGILLIGGLAALSLVPYAGILQATRSWSGLCKTKLPVWHYFDVLRSALLEQGTFLLWIWGVLAVAALLVACILQFKVTLPNNVFDERDRALYGLLSAGLGFVSTMIFFHVVSWPTNIWYYLPIMAVVVVAIDLIFDLDRLAPFVSIVRTVAAVILILGSLPIVLGHIQTRSSNLDLIGQSLARQAGPDDLIVLHPFTDGITFRRYFHRDVECITIPIVRDLSLHRWDELLAQARAPAPIAPVLEEVNRKLRAGHRVWVVTSVGFRPQAVAPPPVAPLGPADIRPWTRLVADWGKVLAYNLQTHATNFSVIDVSPQQSISIYEHSVLLGFSGWRDGLTRR